MARLVLATLVAIACFAIPVYASDDDEPAPNLGLTRGAFFVSIKDMYPNLNLPAMDCGKPLVLKHCRGTIGDRIVVEAAETYRSTALIRDFTLGAEGLLYSASATITAAESPVDFVIFSVVCASMLRALDIEPDEGAAFSLFVKGIEGAVSNLARGSDAWVLETPAAIVVVIAYSASKVRFEVTAQWEDLSIQ